MMEGGTPTDAVLFDVAMERVAQNQKWGEQNHPDGTAPDMLFLGTQHLLMADYARSVTNEKAEEGTVTWFDILMEEVFEAAAEGDPKMLRKELIQSAAVIVAWVEAIDRREG